MFWIFSDEFCFVGFITQIFYILTPITFALQLKNKVLNYERVSIFGLLSLYCNAFIYFWTSIYKRESSKIDPLDFCNLAGFYLGLVYLLIYLYFIHFKINKKLGLIYIAILIVGSVIVWVIIFCTVEKDNPADKIFSWFGVIFNVLEYLPLGFDIIYLIRHKISEKYTLFGAFFGLLNCIAWLAWAIYGYTVNHNSLVHSIVANCLGICLTLGQGILYFLYRRNDSDDETNIENVANNINSEEVNLEEKYEEEAKNSEYIQDYI